METESNAEPFFVFRGDHLALDFINTEIRNSAGGIRDLLTDAETLRAWLSQVGILPANPETEVVPALLIGARRLRGALRQIAEAHVAGEAIPENAVAEVNRVLRSGMGWTQLEMGAGRLQKLWKCDSLTPLYPLIPIAEAAANLFTAEQAEFVHKCSNPACILFFLDTSKNHKRRWCSMSACGNRQKVAAHYHRTHRGAEDTE